MTPLAVSSIFHVNIRLGRKWPAVANALDYCTSILVVAVQSLRQMPKMSKISAIGKIFYVCVVVATCSGKKYIGRLLI